MDGAGRGAGRPTALGLVAGRERRTRDEVVRGSLSAGTGASLAEFRGGDRVADGESSRRPGEPDGV
jgi:hypothetical protein